MNFQPDQESWQSYAKRLEHFFIATRVVNDDEKVSALILQNDPSFFSLLKELSFPIDPHQLTYNEIMDILERHYVGVKNIFSKRKLFYRAYMRSSETASEWHRRLKSLAIDCEFGEFFDEILVDKFVCGFKGKVLRRLYEQDEKLDILDALKIAQLYENVSNVREQKPLEGKNQNLLRASESLTTKPQEADIEKEEKFDQSQVLLLQQQQELQQQISQQQKLLNELLSQSQQQKTQTNQNQPRKPNQQKPWEKQKNYQPKQQQQQQRVQKQNNNQQQNQPPQHQSYQQQHPQPYQQQRQHQQQPSYQKSINSPAQPTQQQWKQQPNIHQQQQQYLQSVTNRPMGQLRQQLQDHKMPPIICSSCGKFGHRGNVCPSKSECCIS